jgi:hypothetical protein
MRLLKASSAEGLIAQTTVGYAYTGRPPEEGMSYSG